MGLLDRGNLQSNIVEIPLSSPEYPLEWKNLSSPPPVVYGVGNTALLRAKKFAVVGSRRTPTNALKLGAEISKSLSKAFVLVTGTADGGDSAAIEGALAAGGNVICLLAGGFSALPQAQLPLLEEVARRGLLLSPYPFEKEVRAFSYEERNRLLAGLSEGVLVLGAGEKSGALITAKYAVKSKKPVFAFPYPPNSASGVGCNALIKKGGYLTECAEDIFRVYGIDLKEEKRAFSLTADEEKVYALLKEKSEAHISELAATGLPAYKLRGVLSALEVKGAVVSMGGNRYSV